MQFFSGISRNTKSKSYTLSVSGNSEIMHCEILISVPYSFEQIRWTQLASILRCIILNASHNSDLGIWLQNCILWMLVFFRTGCTHSMSTKNNRVTPRTSCLQCSDYSQCLSSYLAQPVWSQSRSYQFDGWPHQERELQYPWSCDTCNIHARIHVHLTPSIHVQQSTISPN